MLAYNTGIVAEVWSNSWEDRTKARVFMAEINRLIPPPDSEAESNTYDEDDWDGDWEHPDY